jgi:hypothetical protein
VGSSSKSFDVTVMPRSLTENLQLCYTFETADLYENEGHRMVRDLSRHQRDGELMNARAQVSMGKLDLSANSGNQFSQNGYMLLPEGLIDSLRSYTILFRATPSNLEKQPRFYDFGSASGNSMFLRGNTLAAGLKYSGGTTNLVTASKQMTIREEHTVAVVFSAIDGTTTVYLDGEQVATGTNISREPYELNIVGNDTRNYIGRTQWWQTSSANDNLDYCGTMDDFYVFSMALTADEMESVLEGTLTGIKQVSNVSRAVNNSKTVYDLSGRKVNPQHLPKGIYIIGGKKVIR